MTDYGTPDVKYPNNRLKELREARGLSLRRVAELTGVSFATISKLENAKRNFSSNDIKMLSSFFGVSIDYFLGKEPEDIFKDFLNSLQGDFLTETELDDGSILRRISDSVPEPMKTKLDIIFLLGRINSKESLELIYEVAKRREAIEDFEEDM